MADRRSDEDRSGARDYGALMAAIGWGLVRPGERVVDPDVAERTGIDPQALAALVDALRRDGLAGDVDGEPRVLASDRHALRELIELRVLIEVPLACEAAERGVAPRAGERLTELAERCLEAADRGDELEYTRRDLEFHLHLSGLAAGAEVVELVRLLRVRSRIGAMPARIHGAFMRLNAREHVAIARAVLEARPNAVDTLLRRHISRIRDEWFDVDRDSGGEER